MENYNKDCLSCRVLYELPLEKFFPWEEMIISGVIRVFYMGLICPAYSYWETLKLLTAKEVFHVAHTTIDIALQEKPEMVAFIYNQLYLGDIKERINQGSIISNKEMMDVVNIMNDLYYVRSE